jgi:peptidoglycan/LPS O-acetylase OafA/YrhL
MDPAWRFILFVMNYGRSGEAFSHAWSLCIEEHFYLIFPMLVSLCLWRPNVFRPAVIIALALIGVILLRYYLWSVDAPFYPAVYRPTHTHIDGLTIGVALALVREKRPRMWEKLGAKPLLLVCSGIFLVGLGVYKGLPEAMAYIFSFSLISVGFGALVAAAVAPGFWLSSAKIPFARTLAALAYTLYLTHKQMMHMAAQIIGDYSAQRVLTVALSLILIFAASCALHYGIERPFLRWRDRISSGKQRSHTLEVAAQ